MYLYSDLDAIYLGGDLNGRIGQRPDFVEGLDDVTPRTSIDIHVRGHGEAILEFCNEAKMCVVNGRISPLHDNFTSISNRGSAVVDYFLTRHEDLKNISDFKVITMSSLADCMGENGVGVTPSLISDHSFLLMDVKTRDPNVPDSVEGGSSRGSHSAPVYGAPCGSRGPEPPPRFRINSVPDNFMSSAD